MRLYKTFALVVLFSISPGLIQAQEQSSQPNVLFICIDDLRPELGCYGNKIIKTPNIDRLASEGSVFLKHYVQAPTCGASRYSILTGTYPQAKDQISNEAIRTYISGKKEAERPETFIHQLKRNGYFTLGIGKISHYIDGLYGYSETSEDAPPELPHSWDKTIFNAGKWKDGWDAFFAYADGSSRITRERQVKPYENADVEDNGYPDGLSADLAMEQLDSLSDIGKPFFLGVGFFKPHLPFNAPKQYWDLYNENELKLTESPNIPENINTASLHDNSEFNRYLLGEEKPSLEKPASDDYARKIKHAYYAAASYTDAQVGKLIAKLEEKNLAQNTIVILWSDHGWQLGDHRMWGKHTLFEKSLRSPLIIKVPSLKNQPKKIEKVVSSVDIYPTLMELCRAPMPYQMPGRSLMRLLNPSESAQEWEEKAYSYFNEGITVRVPNFRFTKYYRKETPVIELYDHRIDPNENINIAENYPKIVKKLEKVLEQGNTGLYTRKSMK